MTNKELLQELETTQKQFQFPTTFSNEKAIGLIGNSINIACARYFLKKMMVGFYQIKPFKFIDLFAGIGGFHITLTGFGECILASDNSKDCQEVYQLNFPNTPFFLGDIKDKEVQKRIINTDFDLLCAGFPCQPYSRANTSKNKKDAVIGSLLEIIEIKKPKCLFLENVPQLLNYLIWTEIKSKLEQWGYQIHFEKLCPTDFGIPMKRSRIFIWGQKDYEK